MKTLFVLFLVALAGCTPGVSTAPETLPKGSVQVQRFGRTTSVVPVTLEDGTRCVVAHHVEGSGIACDFSGTKQ